MVELDSYSALDFVPWNCFRFAGIKFFDAASYFLFPCEKITVFISHA